MPTVPRPGLGIGIREVASLVREAQALERPDAFVAVSGPGAAELAAALAAGGDAAAVRVGGDPHGAAAVVRIVEGTPEAPEVTLLRRLAREGTPVLVLRRGAEPVPYVLPANVLDAPPGPDVEQLLEAIARAAGDDAPALAARLPLLRRPVERRIVHTTALANAVLAAAPWTQGAPQLALLSLAQGRMLLLLGLGRGATLARDPKQLARAVGPPLAAAVGLGLGARALVRSLPARGPLVRAAVAYAGTRALAAARPRLP